MPPELHELENSSKVLRLLNHGELHNVVKRQSQEEESGLLRLLLEVECSTKLSVRDAVLSSDS